MGQPAPCPAEGRADRLERGRVLPPKAPRGEGLPCTAGNLGLRGADWRAGARAAAGEGAQEDGPGLGRAVSVRTQGLAEASLYIDVCETVLDDEITFLKQSSVVRVVSATSDQAVLLRR